jgi:PTH1 family peptidyl-tRNA hydrolase
MKYLIAGLGNVGAEYHQTRHNIGFMILDHFAEQNALNFTLNRLAYHTELNFAGRKIILIKPTTYMNLSGKAIQYWLTTEKIPIENLLILTDDLSLPTGTIRIRQKGNDGGHNGLKNINEVMNTNQYARLRFGIGNEFAAGRQVDYVLGKFAADDQAIIAPKITLCADAIKSFAKIGIAQTMNAYNNK